jgi:hypothetical protein
MTYEILFNQAVIGTDISVLSRISDSNINLVNLKGSIEQSLKDYLAQIDFEALASDRPWHNQYYRYLINSNASALSRGSKKIAKYRRELDCELEKVGFKNAEGRSLLQKELISSVNQFRSVARGHCGFSLGLYRPSKIPAWHIDLERQCLMKRPLRGNKTLHGDRGMIWRPNAQVPAEEKELCVQKSREGWQDPVNTEEQSIQHLKVGDLGIFACGPYRGSKKEPLSHATPPMPISNTYRLSMTIGRIK